MSPNKVGNWISGVLVVALLISAIVMGSFESKTAMEDGAVAPGFSFDRFVGGRVSSTDLKGKVLMLDFWATWCPPCVEEMPMLVRVAKEYEGKGVVFVAASSDDPGQAEREVGAFIEKRSPDLKPFAAYANVTSGATFNVRALPTIFIINRQGKIVGSQTGLVSERKIRSWLDKALLSAE